MKTFFFLGTAEISAFVLENLWPRLPSLALQPPWVVTCPPVKSGRGRTAQKPTLLELAERENLPVFLLEGEWKTGFQKLLQEHKPHFILTAAFRYWIPEFVLRFPPLGVLNFHPSLVPAYRGAAPVERQIWNGETEVGISLIQSVSQMDAGPVLAQRASFLGLQENASQLLERLMHLGCELFCEVYPQWQRGQLQPLPQQGEVSFAPKICKEERVLQPDLQTATQMHNQVRALTFHGHARLEDPFPGSGLAFLQILETTPCTSLPEGLQKKGAFHFNRREWFLKGQGEQLLQIQRVKLPNGKVLRALDFLNGYQALFSG